MVFSPAMLIGDTLNRETNIIDRTENLLKLPTGGRLTSWLFRKCEEWNSGPQNINPSSGREEDLNPKTHHEATPPPLWYKFY